MTCWAPPRFIVFLALVVLLCPHHTAVALSSSNFSGSDVTPLLPDQMVRNTIKGYGWHYYTIEVPPHGFLDVILMDERDEVQAGTNDPLDGWVLAVNVGRLKPIPGPRLTNRASRLRILWSYALSSIQHNPFISKWTRYSTRVNINSHQNFSETWWILIQTQQTDATRNDNAVNYPYRVYVNTHTPETFLFIGIMCFMGFLLWWCLWVDLSMLILDRDPGLFDGWHFPCFICMGPAFPMCCGFAVLWDAAISVYASITQWLPLRHRIDDQDITNYGAADNAEAAQVCRICRDEAGQEPLVEPCACRGSVGSVHVSCLRHWQTVSASRRRRMRQNGFRCEVCHEEFNLVHATPSLIWIRLEDSHELLLAGISLGTFLMCSLSLVLVIYLTLRFLVTVLAHWACWDVYEQFAYDGSHPGILGWSSGLFFYVLIALHVYWALVMHHALCEWWYRVQSPVDTLSFSLKNMAGVLLQLFHLVLLTSVAGYAAMFSLYMLTDAFVWSWSVSPVLGCLLAHPQLILVAIRGSVRCLSQWFHACGKWLKRERQTQQRGATPTNTTSTTAISAETVEAIMQVD